MRPTLYSEYMCKLPEDRRQMLQEFANVNSKGSSFSMSAGQQQA
jgi:hypothetical protein